MAVVALSIALGLDMVMYLYLILALVLMGLPVYMMIVRKPWTTKTDMFRSEPEGTIARLVTIPGSISGAFFAIVLVCHQGYSHWWLLALPVLSGGSLYSLFRQHGPVVQAKSSLFGLAVGMGVGLFAAGVVFAVTVGSGLASVDYYIATLSDDDSSNYTRGMAAKTLGLLGDKRAVDPLIKALADDRGWVRADYARALGQLGDKRAIDPLIKALADEEGTMGTTRGAFVHALGQLGDAAVDPLIKALSDGDRMLRGWAAYALGKLGDKRAVDPLIKALADDDSRVRNAAEAALRKLGYKK